MIAEKREKYETTLTMFKGLLVGEHDEIATLANTAALLKERHEFFWVGFFFVRKDELVLGPFQGPAACTRIGFDKGVCGNSWSRNETILVPDVHEYPGHISCNPISRSEIVIPVRRGDQVTMVFDVDSEHLDHFDELDKEYLQAIISHLQKHLYASA